MTHNKKARDLKVQAQITNMDKQFTISTQAQCSRLLEWLKEKPITTLAARKHLDIISVSARILDLRKKGYPIVTLWTNEKTDCGIKHRIALYVLSLSKIEGTV